MSCELWWSFNAGLLGPSGQPRDLRLPLNAVGPEILVELVWGINTNPPEGALKACRRRSLNRAAQQRCRARKKLAQEAAHG